MSLMEVQEFIYYFKCPHDELIVIGESSYWCGECDKWLTGIEVGDVYADVKENGDIVVRGSGYVDRANDVRH